jgi:hypothetical protein
VTQPLGNRETNPRITWFEIVTNLAFKGILVHLTRNLHVSLIWPTEHTVGCSYLDWHVQALADDFG